MYVNTKNLAWKTVEELRQDHYHVVVTVGIVLAEEVRPGERTSDFFSAFLSPWSEAAARTKPLF